MSHDTQLEILSNDQLQRAHGGVDFSAAHRAGVAQMNTGRVPPPYEPPQPSRGLGDLSRLGCTHCMLEPATSGPLGYVSGFARNLYQQFTTPAPKPNAAPNLPWK